MYSIDGQMKQRSNGLPNSGIFGSYQLFSCTIAFVGCDTDKIVKNRKGTEYRECCRPLYGKCSRSPAQRDAAERASH